MTLKETYWKIRALLSNWGSYIQFKTAGEDETERARKDEAKVAKLKRKLAEKMAQKEMLKIKLEHERCRREVQAEIARALEEDEISALLSSEAYKGFEEWLKIERQKERDAKKVKRLIKSE